MAERARTKAEQQLEALLKAWGREYGSDYRDEPRRFLRTLSHPIAQSMQFGAGKKVTRTTRVLAGRCGLDRRRIMGAAAGKFTLAGKPIPIASPFVDPVPCKSRGGSGGGMMTRPVPPALQKVEQSVLRLETSDAKGLIRALCIRVQYAGDGEHADKFAKVNEKLREVSKGHAGISLARYRDELTWGRVWLSGALLEVLAAA